MRTRAAGISLLFSPTATWPSTAPEPWARAATRCGAEVPPPRAPRSVLPSIAITLRPATSAVLVSAQAPSAASRRSASRRANRRRSVDSSTPPRSRPSRCSAALPASRAHSPIAVNPRAPASTAHTATAIRAPTGCRTPRRRRGSGLWWALLVPWRLSPLFGLVGPIPGPGWALGPGGPGRPVGGRLGRAPAVCRPPARRCGPRTPAPAASAISSMPAAARSRAPGCRRPVGATATSSSAVRARRPAARRDHPAQGRAGAGPNTGRRRHRIPHPRARGRWHGSAHPTPGPHPRHGVGRERPRIRRRAGLDDRGLAGGHQRTVRRPAFLLARRGHRSRRGTARTHHHSHLTVHTDLPGTCLDVTRRRRDTA